MGDMTNRIRGRVAEFENIIKEAKTARWADDPKGVADHFLQYDPVLAWRLLDLFDLYEQGGAYPMDRLPGVMDRLIDTKLQLYFVSQVLPGSMNALVYGRGLEHADPLATPGLQLTRLSLTQAFIGQSRALWDRLMGLIYFLETGCDPPGNSIRRRFFRDLSNWSPRWDVMIELEAEIDRYDNKYRTPEYHRGSVLRKELLGGDEVDLNDVMGLNTPVTNGVWTVLCANVSGKPHNIVRLGRHIRSGESSPGEDDET
jgi:hypothetical protein